MKTKLFLIAVLLSNIAMSQSWQSFYTKQNVNFVTTTTTGTNLYLAFTDDTNNYPFAERFNGTNWVNYNGGNAISQQAISRAMTISTGNNMQNKLHLAYVNAAITRVDWYESDNGGNFGLKSTAAPGAGTASIIYEDSDLQLFINITGTLPSGFIYNARIGNKITNFNLLGGRELSGNNSGAGTFSFPRLSSNMGNITATEFDYKSYDNSFVYESYSNGTVQFGKILGTSRQFYGREVTNPNTYTAISGIVGEFKFAAFDATNSKARVSLSPNGSATTTSGIFQYNVDATDHGFFKFRKYDNDYYLFYSDANNKLQIDKFTSATTSWSTLTDPNITADSTNVYDMFYYDGSIHIMHTDTTNTLTILRYGAGLSVDEFSVLECNIYPNPSNSKITLNANEPIESITIYSILGNEVLLTNNTEDVDVSFLKNGTYFIKIYTKSGNTETLKFIKN